MKAVISCDTVCFQYLLGGIFISLYIQGLKFNSLEQLTVNITKIIIFFYSRFFEMTLQNVKMSLLLDGFSFDFYTIR